jgi:hypothetical protein
MLAAALVCVLPGSELRAQLAITEAMSWASNAECPEMGTAGCYPDFWELTNFGTNRIDLSGYLFVDKDAKFPEGAWPIPNETFIEPSESILFVREGYAGVTNPAAFRRWWGEGNLPAGLKIILYPNNYGFDYKGDAVRLWDANSNVVDQLYFGETRRGFTFIYDTNSGQAVQSPWGVCGAFQAATGGDVGSPGYAPCGPVSLGITRQPVTNIHANAGENVTLSVEACGRPLPIFAWFFNGAPLSKSNVVADTIPQVVYYAGCGVGWTATPKATDLLLSNVQPSQAGHYFVVITNGLERLTSAVVTVTVNTNPTLPQIECPRAALLLPGPAGHPQTNLIVARFQTATLTVLAHGYPLPRYRWWWSADGKKFDPLPNSTNSSYVISPASPDDSGVYRVCVTNTVGAITNYAYLTVKPKPQLKITEVMSDECFPAADDWWELTNMGDEPVDLCGYRWDDYPGNIGGGPTITNSIILQPGESVIFLEGQTPESFINWWGASNLPPRLQFICYTANGLESDGDQITVWNAAATDDTDYVDSLCFGQATHGASFVFHEEYPANSIAGQEGAFGSAQGWDVGSPGWTPFSPPCFTSISRDGSGMRLEWKAWPGSTNLLQYTSEFPPCEFPGGIKAAIWTDLGTYTFGGYACTTIDTTPPPGLNRFYRLKNLVDLNRAASATSP